MIRHRAGVYISPVQRCVRCDVVLLDRSGEMAPEDGRDRDVGFPEGAPILLGSGYVGEDAPPFDPTVAECNEGSEKPS